MYCAHPRQIRNRQVRRRAQFPCVADHRPIDYEKVVHDVDANLAARVRRRRLGNNRAAAVRSPHSLMDRHCERSVARPPAAIDTGNTCFRLGLLSTTLKKTASIFGLRGIPSATNPSSGDWMSDRCPKAKSQLQGRCSGIAPLGDQEVP